MKQEPSSVSQETNPRLQSLLRGYRRRHPLPAEQVRAAVLKSLENCRLVQRDDVIRIIQAVRS